MRRVLRIYVQSYDEVVNSVGQSLVTGGGFGVRVSKSTRRIEGSRKSLDEGPSSEEHSGRWKLDSWQSILVGVLFTRATFGKHL